MKDTLCKIFENNSFKKVDIRWKGFDTKTYINDKSETYVVIFVDGLPSNLQKDIVSFCVSELHMSEKLTKANKSNLYIFIAAKVDRELTESQRNHIFMIEESNLYYKKFFLWYSESELNLFKELVGDDYTSQNMNKKLIDYDQFLKFKNQKFENENLGYELLSRLYIKLAFLTLADIETLNRALVEYIKDSVNELNGNLFDEVVDCFEKNGSLDSSLELIDLTEKEIREIDKLMEEVDI